MNRLVFLLALVFTIMPMAYAATESNCIILVQTGGDVVEFSGCPIMISFGAGGTKWIHGKKEVYGYYRVIKDTFQKNSI